MASVLPDLARRFAGRRIVVVGDLMLDRYITGRVRRISPEAPVPVVEVDRTYERPGGAANVAANARRLGAHTTLLGLIGADPDGQRLRDVLSEAGLSTELLIATEEQSTTVKTRIVAHGQQIVRVDRESFHLPSVETAAILIERFARVDRADVLVLSDYAKGVLSPTVCGELVARCRQRGIPVVVDPKGRNYRKYAGATAITPNQLEAAQALGVEDPSDLRADHLRRFFLNDLSLDAALITRGEQGMTLIVPGHPPFDFAATARDVADVTGAGDTVASVFALGVAGGSSCEVAAVGENGAAGVFVVLVFFK
ncbi:MAG: bifunctional heptose 7-phosphate kinase/heptose 1-phosphate adenyltransferase [Chloroflexota bacterium]